MRIYYFIQHTGLETGNSGIQRVVRNLGTALQSIAEIELCPVRWNAEQSAVVHAESVFFECIGLYNGPRFKLSGREGQAIDRDEDRAASWLLVPEVPLFDGPDPNFPFVHIPFIMGYAKANGFRTAFVFYDILPLSHFGEEATAKTDALKFFIYANALAGADVVIPISKASQDVLIGWFARCGIAWRPDHTMRSLLLPEEMIGVERGEYADATVEKRLLFKQPKPSASKPAEFCMWGSIYPHKNQIAIMQAFNLMTARRPDLDSCLHQFGNVHPRLVGKVERAVRESRGRIKTYGFVNDAEMATIIRRCRATVFVSLAEGYGLPLAESLWMGKPCLTSNIPPMTEITAGGGSLLVDPFDIDSIARGFEQLATDPQLLDRLSSEIRSRPFRTWHSYAEDLIDILAAHARRFTEELGEEQPLYFNGRKSRALPILIETLTINPPELAIHSVYREHMPPLFIGRILHYVRNEHGAIKEDVLSYGPYTTLEKGWYDCYLNGVLNGKIKLRVTCDTGTNILSERVIDSLGQCMRFHLGQRTEAVEIVIFRMPETVELTVTSVQLDRYNLGPPAPYPDPGIPIPTGLGMA